VEVFNPNNVETEVADAIAFDDHQQLGGALRKPVFRWSTA
jgi:hypothetical protein